MDIEKFDRIIIDKNDLNIPGIIRARMDALDSDVNDKFNSKNIDIVRPFLNKFCFYADRNMFIINDIENNGTKITITIARYMEGGKLFIKKDTLDLPTCKDKIKYYGYSLYMTYAMTAAIVMNYMPEYINCKTIFVTNKKKNKKIKVHEYSLNHEYFIEDYIGARYSKWDRISIDNNYNLYDPNNILAPVFPLQHGVITSGFESLASIPDDKAMISKNITMKMAIVFNVITKSTISIKAYALNVDGKGEIISNCIYNFKSNTFEKVSDDIPIDTVKANVSKVINDTGDNDIINFCIDVLKYMAYHIELVSKKDVMIGSIESSNNYSPKVNDKPRFETSLCSHKVYGITKKVIPVTETEAKEKRKYTPCQYAVTVKGHFRHYKSGKVIWVEHFIRNKDKEFKPKDYVDKKH